MQRLDEFTLEELTNRFKENHYPGYRAGQVFEYIHKQKNFDIETWTRLPKALRMFLLEGFELTFLEIEKEYVSEFDGTRKFLYRLSDNHLIEGALMKYHYGYTLCVSTQVGCAMGCSFCASTKEGKIRNLTAGEMLRQVYVVEEHLEIKVSRIVLMGSGEPLDNIVEVQRFLGLVHEKNGKNMSYRNMTLSTCGLVPGIEMLAEWNKPINLAISLHYTRDEIRNTYMPINKKYNISKLTEACRLYYDKTGRRISFEYIVIDGLNDRRDDILALGQLVKSLQGHVNLIPYNPIEEFDHTAPQKKNIYEIKEMLEKLGVAASVRRELGQDINASCGQLRRSYKGDNDEN